MSCEHLVCAACAGPVEQGRCPVCRAARAQLHHHGVGGMPAAAVAVIIAALGVLVLLLLGHWLIAGSFAG